MWRIEAPPAKLVILKASISSWRCLFSEDNTVFDGVTGQTQELHLCAWPEFTCLARTEHSAQLTSSLLGS